MLMKLYETQTVIHTLLKRQTVIHTLLKTQTVIHTLLKTQTVIHTLLKPKTAHKETAKFTEDASGFPALFCASPGTYTAAR